MLLFAKAAVKSILELGRNFPWTKPHCCPRCGGRIWRHGFTARYFDDSPHPVFMRRYRCPACRLVVTTRPSDYWGRFQASITDIRDSLTHRFQQCRWGKSRSTSRQRHWLKGLLAKIRCHLGLGWTGNPMDAFEQLLAQGHCPVGRSI